MKLRQTWLKALQQHEMLLLSLTHLHIGFLKAHLKQFPLVCERSRYLFPKVETAGKKPPLELNREGDAALSCTWSDLSRFALLIEWG